MKIALYRVKNVLSYLFNVSILFLDFHRAVCIELISKLLCVKMNSLVIISRESQVVGWQVLIQWIIRYFVDSTAVQVNSYWKGKGLTFVTTLGIALKAWYFHCW